MGYFTRDVNQVPDEGLEGLQVGWYLGGEQCTFKNGKTFRMPHYPNLPNLYCQDLDSDKRLVNQATFTFKVVNPPSTYQSAPTEGQVDLNVEFWASYTCKFMVRGLSDPPLEQPQMSLVIGGTPELNGPPEGSADDAFGFVGPTYLSTLDIPECSKGYIPGLFVGKMALPSSERKADGKSAPTSTSVYGIAAGFGLDSACGWTVGLGAVKAANFGAGFNLEPIPSIQINCERKMWVGMNYLATTSNVTGMCNIQVTVPGVKNTVFLPEGYWLADMDGNWSFYGEAGVNLDVIWLDALEWASATSDYSQPDITYLQLTMNSSNEGPPLASWAGEATVEGKAWRAWQALTPKERHNNPFKAFLSRFKQLRKPDTGPSEDELSMRRLLEECKAQRAGLLVHSPQGVETKAPPNSPSVRTVIEQFEMVSLPPKGLAQGSVILSNPLGSHPVAGKDAFTKQPVNAPNPQAKPK
jgi:hypothetical protein